MSQQASGNFKLVMDDTLHKQSLSEMMKALLLNPAQLLTLLRDGGLQQSQVFLTAFVFLIAASLLFAAISVISPSVAMHFTPWQFMLRFFFVFGASLILIIPALTLVWAVMQKISSWYMDIKIPFVTILGITGLGIFYYALMFMLGMPLILLKGVNLYLVDGLLFGLNLGAFILSVRLFKQTYTVYADVSGKKATFTALFPLLIMTVVWLANQLLVYFAVHPYVK